LETAVWVQIVAALSDEQYLEGLIGAHLADTTGGDDGQSIANLRRRRANLRDQETNIVRQLAAEGDLHGDALDRALGETIGDRITVEKELERLQEAQEDALTAESVPGGHSTSCGPRRGPPSRSDGRVDG
jgi:hypothetical protein